MSFSVISHPLKVVIIMVSLLVRFLATSFFISDGSGSTQCVVLFGLKWY